MQTAWFQPNFKQKIIISVSLIILLILSISGYTSYRLNMSLFEKEINKQFSKANEQTLARVDFRVQDIYRISNYILFNKEVEGIIKRASLHNENSKFVKYKDSQNLEDLMLKISLDAPNLLGLYLYDLLGEHINYGDTSLSIQGLDHSHFQQLHERLKRTNGNILWERMSIPSDIEKDGTREVIVAARLMRSFYLEDYGMLVMVFDQTVFSNYIDELTQGQEGYTYLFDREGHMLYSNDNTPPSFHSLNRLAEAQLSSDYANEYIYARQASKETGFSLISRVSLSEMRQAGQAVMRFTFISALAGIILSAILISVVIKKLLQPMKALVQGMRHIREGRFNIRIDIQTNDELAMIGQSFNAMAEHINNLIQEVYERKLNEREAELKAIQAQLNPHFLYNTLDMIYWNLFMKEDEETAHIVISLSNMLRYSLQSVNLPTTVAEEFQQVGHYLTIQSARYGDTLKYHIELEPEMKDCTIIRMIVQPLVENIFVHAFRDKTEDKKVVIRGFKLDSKLYIEVVDNGSGMDEETVKLIQAGSSGYPESAKDSIGIRSVIRRIQLIYGVPYGLQVESQPEKGTTMTLILPAELGETEDLDNADNVVYRG